MAVAFDHLEVVDDFALVPDVVAGGDYVDVEFEQFFRECRSDPEAGRGIFAVGDDQIDGAIAHNLRQLFLDDVPSGPSENVANEENTHRN